MCRGTSWELNITMQEKWATVYGQSEIQLENKLNKGNKLWFLYKFSALVIQIKNIG